MASSVTSEVSSTTVNPGSADNMGLSSVFLYIYLTLAIITISGNGIVIISYVIDKSIRLSTQNTYILNLAIADFLVGVFDFLANFIWSISGANSNPSSIPCFLWGWFWHAVTLFSAFVVLLLSWDRYKLVSNALTYRRDQTPRKAALRSAIAWAAVCAYISVLHLIGLLFSSGASGSGCIPSEAPSHVIIISFFPEFLLPLSAIVGLNVKVLLALRRRTLSKIGENLAHEHALRTHSCFNGNTEQTSSNISSDGESKISPKHLDIQETSCKNILDKADGVEHKIDAETSGIQDIEATTVNIQIELDENGGTQLSDKEREQTSNVSNSNAPVSPKVTTGDENVCKEGSEKKRIQKSQVSKKTKMEMHKSYKAVKALLIFTCIYISCWIPFYVISLVSLIKSDMAVWVPFLGTLILAFNSTINPFLYAAMSMKFRRRFLLLLKCHFSRN